MYVDHDPQGNTDIHVHCEVTVEGDRLIIDFDGSDTRPNINAWSTFGNTRGNVIAQLASLVDPSIPKNEGFFNCIDLRVPEGCCLNPAEGKPVSSGTHHPGVEVGDAIAIAMSKIIPDRCCPQSYKFGSPRQMWGDLDPRTGKPFFDHGGEVSAGWVSAAKGTDGWGALAASMGNLIKASAEINEQLFPHILRGRNYLTDSGGAGPVAWRLRQPLHQGGAHADLGQPVRRQPASHPPGHRRRRTTARPTICHVGKTCVETAVSGVLLDTGERLDYRFGGGGGWGDPLRPRPAGGARRRVGRVRVGRGRAARLRRRHHRERSRT